MQIDRIGGLSGSIAIKIPCRVATTANIVLSGLLTVDGVVLVADDRVLVKNQTTGSENGIYVVATGTWSRAPDFDGSRDIAKGTLVKVTAGTVGGGFLYEVTAENPITVGTTAITIAMFSTSLASGVTNTPAGNVAAITVQAAINELDVEKALLAGSASQNFAMNAGTVAGKLTATGNIITDAFVGGAGKGLFFRAGFEITTQPGITVFDIDASGNVDDIRVNGFGGGGLYANDTQALKWLAAGITIPGTLDVTGKTTLGAPANLKNYTVATLPAGVRGDVAYVTDALAPTFLAAVASGGAVVTPVFYNGAAWVAG